MNDVELAEAVRAAVRLQRQQGRIPTEVLLRQGPWNTLRRHMTYGSHGARQTVLFDGIPCVLVVGPPKQPGFTVRGGPVADRARRA